MHRTLLFFSIVFFAVSGSFAQIDTSFWFTAPDVSSGHGDSPAKLRILSYAAPATVTIWQPANGTFTPITVALAANSVDSVDLTPFLAGIENAAANVTLTNGLRISSTAPVNVIYEINSAGNKEFFTLKGQKAVGTDFYTPFQKFWANGTTTPKSFSSIEIVATQNATTVLITPRTNIIGHNANITYSVTLNAGETYCARDTNSTAVTSLAGSIISANKPVAVTVFTGAVSESGCLSSMGDQLTTSDQAGTDFIVHRGTGNNERIYVLATQNNTTLNYYSSSNSSAVINWSETNEYNIGSDTVVYVKTNKPVYVWHVSGYGCKLSGAQVPNIYCAGTYTTSFTRTTADSFGLHLFVRTGFENLFQVNGAAGLINASDFKTVPGTSGNFKSALIYLNTAQVPVNSYNAVTNSGDIFGLSIMQGSSSGGSAYGFLSEFTSYPFVVAGNDDTVCANVPLSLSGFVGGGSVTGSWSGTGYGTFQNGNTALANVYVPSALDTAVSPIKIILSSTGPCPVVRDTIVLEVTSAPIVNASADQSVCANNANVQLNGSVTGGATTGVWTSSGTGSFSPSSSQLNAVYIPSASDTAAGNLTLVLTSTNFGNCAAVSDTMLVTISNAPIADAGADTIIVCANNASVSLSGAVYGPTSTGKWTTTGNGIFSPNNISLTASYTPDASDILAGSITIYLSSTNNNGCSPATDSIKVIFTSAPVVDAGANGFACANSPSFQLNGSVTGPTTSGVWSGGSGTYAPSATVLNPTYTPSASEISAGSVILTLTSTSNGGCNAVSDNVKFDFVTPPFANFAFTNECLGESTSFTDFSLQGFGSITGWSWTFGDGTNSSAQHPVHLYAAPGTYSVAEIVTSSVGCSDTVLKTVSVYALPVAAFTYTSVCTGTNLYLTFSDNTTVTTPDSLTTWLWDFGGQGGSTQQNPPAQIFNGVGNYSIQMIVATNNGCMDTAQTTITVQPKPSAGFYFNTTTGFNVGAQVNFIDSSSYAQNYNWTFGDGETDTISDPQHTYFNNGTFSVTLVVSDNLGCTDTATALVVIANVSNEITTLIPNAISPNGDGKNDFWKLSFINLLYPKAVVEVFNKWGQQVFYDDEGYIVPFAGQYRGEDLPAGSYYYVINLNDPAHPDPYTGSLLIVR